MHKSDKDAPGRTLNATSGKMDRKEWEDYADPPKTCWRCGYKISSGIICPMCGAVNKEPSAYHDEEKTLTPEDAGQQPDRKGGDTIHAGAYSFIGEVSEARNGFTTRNGTGDAFEHDSTVPISEDPSIEGQAKVINEMPEATVNVDPENITKHESTKWFSSESRIEGSVQGQAHAVKGIAKRLIGVGLENVTNGESAPEILSHPGFEGSVQGPATAVKEVPEPTTDTDMLEGRGDEARRFRQDAASV